MGYSLNEAPTISGTFKEMYEMYLEGLQGSQMLKEICNEAGPDCSIGRLESFAFSWLLSCGNEIFSREKTFDELLLHAIAFAKAVGTSVTRLRNEQGSNE